MRSRAVCFGVGLPLLLAALSGWGQAAEPKTPIRVGIIGLDTSHVIAFTDIMNNPRAGGDLADVQVVAGYPGGSPDLPSSRDRVEKFTEQLRGKGLEICDSIEGLLTKVDAVLLESVDGRPHLEQVRPVFAAGKPVFIDKPLAGSLADAIEIVRLSREHNVPFFSSSSTRFSPDFQALRGGESDFGEIRKCVASGPMSIEPHHPDLFWYGVHGVEILYTILGPGCKTVRRLESNKVEGRWEGDRLGVFHGTGSFAAEVEGSQRSGTAGKYAGYQPLVAEIARFFKTRKPPIDPEETLELFAFMEAADESKRQGGAAVSIEQVMKTAREAAARKRQLK